MGLLLTCFGYVVTMGKVASPDDLKRFIGTDSSFCEPTRCFVGIALGFVFSVLGLELFAQRFIIRDPSLSCLRT